MAMRLVLVRVLLLAAFGVFVAGALATAPSFVRGGVYRGTSRYGSVRIQVAANGKTAGVDMGMAARCSGTSHYTFPFVANFHRNPARIHGPSMSVTEVDHNLPSDHQIPAARVVHQAFAAHATGSGRTLAGTYKLTSTLTDGRSCATGRVRFTAGIR
jgi:hypothetical protein